MIDLRASLLCSIEQKVCEIGCRESYFNCIGKNSALLKQQRLTLINLWRMFKYSLTPSQLNTLDCYYTDHFGTKSVIVQQQVTTPTPVPAPPITATLALDSSSPAAITDFYGLSAEGISVGRQQATNTTWIDTVEQLSPLFIEPVDGSPTSWALFGTSDYQTNPNPPSDGYNVQIAEVNARGENINNIIGGVGSRTYGYGFFEDFVAYDIQMTPQPAAIISVNMVRPALIQNDPSLIAPTGYTDPFQITYNEIDYAVGLCNTNSVDIHLIQLGYEDNLLANADVFLTLDQMTGAIQTSANYIKANYPSIKISSDADNWDVHGGHIFPGFSAAVNNLTGIDYVRQYFQFDAELTNYSLNRQRITELPDMFDYFSTTFTHGQKMRISQSSIKIGNPLRFMIGEGLIFSELLMNLIRLTITRPGILYDFTHYDCSRVVSGSNNIYPVYYMMVMMRGAFNNDGLIDYTMTGTSELVVLPVKNGSNSEVYILNPTPSVATISNITLDGVQVNGTLLSYYGNPTSPVMGTSSLSPATSVILQPYSISRITTSVIV